MSGIGPVVVLKAVLYLTDEENIFRHLWKLSAPDADERDEPFAANRTLTAPSS